MNEAESRQKITGEVAIPAQLLQEIQRGIRNIADVQDALPPVLTEDVSKILNFLLASAIQLDASDIHFEREEEAVKMRVRIDGVLQDVTKIKIDEYEALLSRIKLLSGIKLNIEDRPQDGRFSFLLDPKSPMEIRVATLPSEYGESVVLRILNPKNLLTLKELGLRSDLQRMIQEELKKPNGMIIVTGPTGSGKTTTLYACLKEIVKPEIKIITIEDPIEYHLEGISQTQVHPEKGYDFASGLRAIVRQDPDVILVGEIRDAPTAQIAIQAALTGHLVFSTLHTNDAAGTISRLFSLDAKPVNVSAALNIVIAQRLVRKVCTKCAALIKIPPDLFKKIKTGLANVPRRVNVQLSPTMRIAKPEGCKDCNFTGYRGRIGIFEFMQVNDLMEEYILKNPPIASLRKFAIQQGMVTMYQDGLLKVLERVTTMEEVERVTKE